MLRLLGLLLVAAIVVGIGTTADKGWSPVFRGAEPKTTPEETASRSMLALATTASDLAQGPDATPTEPSRGSAKPSSGSAALEQPKVDAKAAQELQRTAKLLRRHVELLTPGMAARVEQERGSGAETSPSTAADGTAPPHASASAPTSSHRTSGSEALTRVAAELGTSAEKLLDTAATSGASGTAAVLGAGIEQRLEAQRLATLIPGKAKKNVLPPVKIAEPEEAWRKALASPLPAGSCAVDASASSSASTGDRSTAPASSSRRSSESATPTEREAAASIAQASDGAFRQAYGYQMAAVKHPGASTQKGWGLTRTTTQLGHRLEDLLPDGCAPTRAAAYALPRGFDAAPLPSIADSEEQLAGLLRDAAARAPESLRPAMIAETWRAADRFFTMTRRIPDLTETS